MPHKFRVAISGAGPGGLALATFICQNSNDIAVDVYETKPEVSILGTPLAVWKRIWKVLLSLKLDVEMEKRKLPLPKEGEARGPIFRKNDELEGGFDFLHHMTPYGFISIPRPALPDMLQEKCTDKCTVHLSHNMKSYELPNSVKVVINFEDSSTATADVLIGTYGVHSATRKCMYYDFAREEFDISDAEQLAKLADPKWSSQLCYRGTISADSLAAKYPDHHALARPKIWCGKNKHLVSHPFGGNISLIFFYNVEGGEGTTFSGPWVTDVNVEEVRKTFEGWEPSLLALLELTDKFSRWAIHVVDPLPKVTSGKVAIIGDAAHAMTPHQGIGGGQALEDEHIFGHLLAHDKCTLTAFPVSWISMRRSACPPLSVPRKPPDLMAGCTTAFTLITH